MPPVNDPDQVRARLRMDPVWAAYALGDLAPGYSEHCEWRAAAGPVPAVVLLYRAFETPVLFALGPAGPVAGLLDEVRAEPRLYFSIRPEILPLVEARWRLTERLPMWRMALAPGTCCPPPEEGVAPLSPADLPALRRLYADGVSAGQAPDFFDGEMLARGVFFGIWEGRALAAAAGTHLVAPEEGVAAVGNVYTRRDRRGRGLARRVAGAVTAELLRRGLPLLVLNVSQQNAAALKVYQGLGYERACPFYEGLASLD